MGWYLRKSVRMGPVRWNLSKSGIGMSVGVRGLRVGTGPRGSYIAGGRGGLYFRQPLGRATTRRPGGQRSVGSAGGARLAAPPATLVPPTVPGAPAVPFASSAPVEYLPETQVNAFTPATADALARYITAQRAHMAYFWWAVGVFTAVNLMILGNLWPLAILTLPASVYAAYVIRQWDRQRTHVLLHYELDSAEQTSYLHLCAGLQALAAAARLVRVESRQVHGDWKHNAGATTALQLSPATVVPPGSIPWLETNVPVWSLRWRQGNLALIFLPDRMLIEQGQLTAAVPYAHVQITTAFNHFVESGSVPPDARVLTYTWQFTNKNGGPDRRFKANRRLPVTEAVYLGFHSASGLTLLLQASNREKVAAFAQSFQSFRPLICAEPPVIA